MPFGTNIGERRAYEESMRRALDSVTPPIPRQDLAPPPPSINLIAGPPADAAWTPDTALPLSDPNLPGGVGLDGSATPWSPVSADAPSVVPPLEASTPNAPPAVGWFARLLAFAFPRRAVTTSTAPAVQPATVAAEPVGTVHAFDSWGMVK